MNNGFTPTEARLIEVLSDGKVHPRLELVDYLPDPLSSYDALKMHLGRLRKKLQAKDEDLVFVAAHKVWGYRHVRNL